MVEKVFFLLLSLGLSAYYCHLCKENLKDIENNIRNQRYHLERERMIQDSIPKWLWDAYCKCVADIDVKVREKYETPVWDFYDYSPNPRMIYNNQIKIVIPVKKDGKKKFIYELIDIDVEKKEVIGFHDEVEKKKTQKENNEPKEENVADVWLEDNYDEVFQLTKGFKKNAIIPWDLLPDKEDKKLLNEIGCKIVINYGLSSARISAQGLRISVL